jgi:DNA-nicking Smr family endonuclease
MPKKPEISPDDLALFRHAVGDAAPVAQNRIAPYREPPAPIPRQLQQDEQQVLHDMLSDAFDDADLETGEELLFCRPGLQHSLLKRLKRGHFSVCAELDLHGLTRDRAREALAAFLKECRAKAILCVRIIHGKGNGSPHRRPVLKGRVNHWLQQRDEVLAFCSARPADGGTGAVYVLLKRG